MAKYETITKKDFTVKEMTSILEHSLLVPYASQDDVRVFIENDVKRYGFKICCLNNCNVELGAKLLAGTDVIIDTGIAFPFGTLTPECKEAEIERAIGLGAGEIDIVTNIGAIKSADWDLVYRDMSICADKIHSYGKVAKVILECCYLTKEEIVKGCEIAMKAGMDYVKTSTGFGPSAAILGDVALMKKVVGDDFGVKPAGPIGDYETAVAMINAGAHRIGSRRSVEILHGCTDWKDYE